MKDPDAGSVGGLPDAGGLNINYQETLSFEPTDDQLEMIMMDVESIADGVRAHLTDQFTVSTRIDRTGNGLQGYVIVEFPTGEAIGPGIPITAERFEDSDEPDWKGPISPEEIEEMTRQITTSTVAQWAQILERVGGGDAIPAS